MRNIYLKFGALIALALGCQAETQGTQKKDREDPKAEQTSLASSTNLAATTASHYTCDDIPHFKFLLRDLESSCGSGGICRAWAFAGSDVESAIQACISPQRKRSYCASSVVCEKVDLCKSWAYAGGSVAAAIAECTAAQTGKLQKANRSYCAYQVTCSPEVSYCSAWSYEGATIEEAITECTSAQPGLKVAKNRAYCAEGVTCVGRNRKVCKSWHWAGATIEAAISECTRVTNSRSYCASNVVCK